MVRQPERPYLAIIGDIVGSRGVDPGTRRLIQERLLAAFSDLTPGTTSGLAAQPLITLGDEFQFLDTGDAAGARAAMEQLPRLLELVRPAEVRFGLGLGELTTDLAPQALGMDGPCFHRARAALTRAHDTDTLIQFQADRPAADAVWSTLAAYALRSRSDWSGPQREAITRYEELGTWSRVADDLGVTRGAVSLRQQAAGWSLYRQAWQALTDELVQRVTPEENS